MDGAKYVDVEMKRALFGVKQMKEVMEKNEEKHAHLMRSLRHSGEKKKVRHYCSPNESNINMHIRTYLTTASVEDH